MTTNTHEVVYLPIDDLIPADDNPKRHDIHHLRRTISRFGLVTPGLIDARTGKMVVGHGRRQALLAMRDDGETPPRGVVVDDTGTWTIPMVTGWASTSDSEAAAYLVADNQTTINGGWDNPALSALLNQIGEVDTTLVDLTGVDRDLLDDLIRANIPPDLDDLADELGEPHPSDTWPTIRIAAPHHVVAAWREHLRSFAGDDGGDAAALAALLDVDVEP